MLFGIPSRTTNNFLHHNKALSIGGKLCINNGQLLEVVRRNGNKITLLSPEGIQLDDAVLAPLLH